LPQKVLFPRVFFFGVKPPTKYIKDLFISHSMKGKARCPHCKESVVVEVPDGATGEQIVTCPNCGMKFKVDVSEKYSWEEEAPLIHPAMHIKPKSMKPVIAGILLIIIFLSGIAMSGILLLSFDSLDKVNMPSEFKGRVVDSSGKALEGIKVEVVGHPELNTTTDEKGYFVIKNITSGRQKLHLTGEGYKSLTAEIFVLPWNITISYEKFVMKEGSGEIEQKSLIIKVFEFGPLLSSIIIVLSIGALIGGILAITRKYFVIATIGAVIGIIAGFFTLIGIVLGLVALILLLISKDEFESKPKEVKY